ncbi:MAG TPA: S8 family serine peptidase [Longimicrobium sp.]|nr:S8 family serine peptidase [Longimicrobium sp.]
MKQARLASFFLAGAVGAAACDRHPAEPLTPESAAPSLAVSADREIPELTSDGGVVYVPGQIIARFRPGASAERNASAAGASVARPMRLARTFILNVPVGKERQIAAALSRNPNLEFAELDVAYELVPCETGECETTNDPAMGFKWDLHNNGTITTPTGAVLQNTPRADADTDWLEAYDALGSGFSGAAVIGIIDTGVRRTHQDLAGKVVAERNFATGYPADFTDDRNSHGTHVAGIAAAHGNNGLGVSGVAYGRNVRIINAKACELYQINGVTRTTCPGSATADAIVWATDQGANVLNLSLGGSPDAPSGLAIHQAALQYARSRNVLPFCAAGNESYPGISWPARFPECVAVGATTWGDVRASYSNYAAELDLAAPGGGTNPAGTPFSGILGPVYFPPNPSSNTTYAWKSGTSMASPHAAGLAALLFATGMTDADAVLERIRRTVDDLGPAGFDPEFGAGRVNVCRALDPAQLTVTMPGSFNRTSDGVLTVVVHAVPGFDPARLDEAVLRLGDGTAPGAAVAIRGDEYRAALADADADGDLDLVVKFDRPELATNVASGSTELVLRGNVGCRRVEGRQDVNVIR